MKKRIAVISALCALLALLFCPKDAVAGASNGLRLCANVIVPSLLPFFVITSLLNDLGLAGFLGRRLEPLMSKLFGVSGCGASAFILGVTGGYPLGASAVADLRSKGAITRDEGENLLAFCNNSGPAFIVGAAGVGVFGSSAAGLLLFGAHVAAAVMTGVLLSKRAAVSPAGAGVFAGSIGLAEALPAAVKKSVMAVINICGFVVTFSVLVGILDALGVFTAATGFLAARLHLELHFTRAFLTGLLELGSGIGAMEGMAATPGNLALASFILGWGGISVHFQTMSVLADTDLTGRRHILGRLCCAAISAVISFLIGAMQIIP